MTNDAPAQKPDDTPVTQIRKIVHPTNHPRVPLFCVNPETMSMPVTDTPPPCPPVYQGYHLTPPGATPPDEQNPYLPIKIKFLALPTTMKRDPEKVKKKCPIPPEKKSTTARIMGSSVVRSVY